MAINWIWLTKYWNKNGSEIYNEQPCKSPVLFERILVCYLFYYFFPFFLPSLAREDEATSQYSRALEQYGTYIIETMNGGERKR